MLKFVSAVFVEQVKVLILDINDNTPTFSETQYVVDVSEGVAPGTEILSVSAIDLDDDQHLFFTIHSVTSPASNNKFKINSVSGTSHCPVFQCSYYISTIYSGLSKVTSRSTVETQLQTYVLV